MIHSGSLNGSAARLFRDTDGERVGSLDLPDSTQAIADEIIATGRVTHAYFGLATVPIPPAAAAQAGVPEGLYVQAVRPGGPAATAGLRAEDVITTIDGEPATSNLQLEELTLTKKPGDTVSIGYTRAGQSATATITLGAQP